VLNRRLRFECVSAMTEYRVRQHWSCIIDCMENWMRLQAILWIRASLESVNVKAILLNFEGVDYMSSTGIALMIELIMQATRWDAACWRCGLSEPLCQDLSSARLAIISAFFPDEAAGVAGLPGKSNIGLNSGCRSP